MSAWRLRLRAIAAAKFTLIIAALLIALLAGGWVAYDAYAGADSTEEQVVSAWELSGTFDHQATVTAENSSLYEEGDTLEDRRVYPTELAPTLEGEHVLELEATESGEVAGEVELVMQTRSVEPDRTGDQTDDPLLYWERTETLATQSFDSLSDEESVTTSFDVNMSAIAAETEAINKEFGNPVADEEIALVAVTTVDGTVNGETVQATEEHLLAMSIEGNTMRIEEVDTAGTVYERTEPVTATGNLAQMPVILGTTAAVGATLLLVALGVLRWRGRLTLSTAERRRLEYHDHQETYDAWISAVELPARAEAKEEATAASLADLVNIAIDTGNRVLEDPVENRYYVVGDEYLFVYVPPSIEVDGTAPTGVPTIEEPTSD